MNLLAHIDSRPWAILPTKLAEMRAFAAQNTSQFEQLVSNKLAEMSKTESPQSYSSSSEQSFRLRLGTVNPNGIAILNVNGALFNADGIFDDIMAFYFGGTSMKAISADIEAAANNPAVKAIVLKFNTPGGDAFGCGEIANQIYQARSKKPVVAFAYGMCCSAGYFWASACTEIVAEAGSWLGSIGTVCGWSDWTDFYANLGIAYEEVTSSNAPYKRLDIRIPEERAVFQSEVDGIENVFIKAVAKYRKTTVDNVKQNYGKGAVMAGWEAKNAGMADSVETLDNLVKRLRKNNSSASAARNSATSAGENEVELKEALSIVAAKLGLTVSETAPNLSIIDQPEATQTGDPAASEETPKAAEPVKTVEAPAASAEPTKEDKIAAITASATTAAENFATGEIKAGRLFPTEKADFIANFVQSSIDDDMSPLASGSRVERIKAQQSARKANQLTDEKVQAEANQVLLASAATGANTEEKKDTILASTDLGRKALKLRVNGK